MLVMFKKSRHIYYVKKMNVSQATEYDKLQLKLLINCVDHAPDKKNILTS